MGFGNELVHFVDFTTSRHPYGMNSSTCGLYNKLVHLWTYKSSFVETNIYTGHI